MPDGLDTVIGRPGGPEACDVGAVFDGTRYVIHLPATCIGNPATFGIAADMAFEDGANATEDTWLGPGVTRVNARAGYWMVTADGEVHGFGNAQGLQRRMRFNGTTQKAVDLQSLVPDPDGAGYWLVAADGGVFAFEAPFRGSMAAIRLNKPITGMVPNGNGYLMVGEDGGIFNFSDKPYQGSLGSNPPALAVTSVAALDES
jgi:hypothetical protein